MKFDFFNESKPSYIAVNIDGFSIDGKLFQTLECFIKEITPVRKLFNGKKIECYSNDAKKGKDGELCALCPKRMTCRQRIRLMLLVCNNKDDSIAAQLEINNNSFSSLKKMLEPIKDDDLSNLLTIIKVKMKDKYLQIQFNPIF